MLNAIIKIELLKGSLNMNNVSNNALYEQQIVNVIGINNIGEFHKDLLIFKCC